MTKLKLKSFHLQSWYSEMSKEEKRKILRRAKKNTLVNIKECQVSNDKGLLLDLCTKKGSLWSLYLGINHLKVEPFTSGTTMICTDNPLLSPLKTRMIKKIDLLREILIIQVIGADADIDVAIDTNAGTITLPDEKTILQLYSSYKLAGW